MQRYTALDVETANNTGGAICQIGLVIADGDDVVTQRCDLIDPDARFDPFCVSVHHITPRMVEGAPRFPELWREIAPYFTPDTIVLAHNAAFDLGQLTAMLRRYRLPVPKLRSCCTVQMARRRFPRTLYGSYTLDTITRAFSIPLLQHHDALCDARACFELFRCLRTEYGDDPRDVRPYRGNQKQAQQARTRQGFSVVTMDDLHRRSLQVLLQDTDPCAPLSPADAMAVAHWAEEHAELVETPPFDEVLLCLYRMAMGKPLSPDEAQRLRDLIE